MREIKFRAWLKEEKIMINVSEIDFRGEEVSGFDESDVFYEGYGYDYAELMQYIGLKDKNGKEIYEDDIVKCVSEIHSNLGPTGKFDTSYYEICGMEEVAYGFGTREIGKEYISRGVLRVCAEKYYEVIGNIYENPELLEVEQCGI